MHKKKVWVLLRGLVREKRHWGDFPNIFKSHFPGDDILLYDFPGNGQRCKENSKTSIVEMVDNVRSFVDDQSVSGPVNIIALSLGGMVAVEWMHRYPDECNAGILISTSLRGLNPFYQRLLPSTYPAVFGALLLPGSIRKKESSSLQFISNIVANDANKRDSTVDNWVSYAQQCPVSGRNGLRQLLAAIRFRVPASRPQVPMLVLGSQADRLVSPLCSINLASHWQLPIEMHQAAGHDIPLDDGDWVCEKIKLWLENQPIKNPA